MNALAKLTRTQQTMWKQHGQLWSKLSNPSTANSSRLLATGQSTSSLSNVTTSNEQPHGILNNIRPPPPPSSEQQLQQQLEQPHPSTMAMAENALCTESPLVFDTHKLVRYLNAGGLSLHQSEAITSAIVRISQQASKHHSEHMVTKSEFSSLRAELSILEKADFALLKTDINSIEKRLETSVAEIYTSVERVENRVIKWVIAVAGAIGLAIVRMMSTSSSDTHRSSGVPRPPTNVVCHQQHQYNQYENALTLTCQKHGYQLIDI